MSASAEPEADAGPAQPSGFYRAWLWRLGMRAVRFLPAGSLRGVCLVTAEAYYRLHRSRRTVVVQNLLPVFHGDAG